MRIYKVGFRHFLIFQLLTFILLSVFRKYHVVRHAYAFARGRINVFCHELAGVRPGFIPRGRSPSTVKIRQPTQTQFVLFCELHKLCVTIHRKFL